MTFVMNVVCLLWHRMRFGRWCQHAPDDRRAALIDTGMRKMWWCEGCGLTEFSSGMLSWLPRPLNPPRW